MINIHNAENWLGIDGDSELSLFKPMKAGSGVGVDSDDGLSNLAIKGNCGASSLEFIQFFGVFSSIPSFISFLGAILSDDDSESVSREASPCSESPRPVSLGSESPFDNNIHNSVMTAASMSTCVNISRQDSKVCSKHFFFCTEFLVEENLKISIYFFLFVFRLQVTVATQTGHECPDHLFNPDKMTVDKHCYECKVRYRDPKPQDLVMYLHAWKYRVCRNVIFMYTMKNCERPSKWDFA